jgi:multisubunit Na+/H+ antiporter MnhC subunit
MGTNLLDFGDPFVRESWACILPSAFVILFCATLIPVPGRARSVWQRVSRPFRNSLTLEEAEAYEAAHENEKGSPADHSTPTKSVTSIFRTTILSGLALLQVLVWLGLGSYSFAVHAKIRDGILPVVTAATWLYASLRPIIWPSQTVFYDLFALYLAHLVTGFTILGGLFFDHSVYQLPLPSRVVLAARVVNLSVLAILLVIVLNMPFAVPSARVNKDDVGKSVSPEDYCSLWDWISFHWVVPLIKKGTYNTLNEDDVWKLSPTLSSRPLTSLFKDLGHAHIVWKLWTANSGDMIWDFLLTLVSVTFTYAGPFFLQRILAAIDNPTPENRAKAYIYAFAAFLTTLLKVIRHLNHTTRDFSLIIPSQAETDCLHLWFGRRAQVRIRTLLMASIYDKALKRKDFSGTVRKDDKTRTRKRPMIPSPVPTSGKSST